MKGCLVFPAFFIAPGGVGGVEYAAYNFLMGCSERGQEIILHVHNRNNINNDAMKLLSRFSSIRVVQWRLPSFINRFLMEEMLTMFAPYRARLVYFNYYLPFALTLRRDLEAMVFIHDFLSIDRAHGVQILRRWFQRFCFSRAVRRSRRLLFVSNFTKERAVHHFGPAASTKGLVVHNGVVWHQAEITERVSDLLQRRYILVVSNDYPHKNVAVVIEAVRLVREQWPDLELVVVGKPMASYRFMRRAPGDRGLELSGHPDYRFVRVTWNLSAGELASLYEGAALVAFPSLYEGFGLPAVEAIGYGAPLLTTRSGAIPEVAGSAAYYVADPTSCQTWAEAIRMILSDRDRYRPSPEAIAQVREAFAPSRVVLPLLAALRG